MISPSDECEGADQEADPPPDSPPTRENDGRVHFSRLKLMARSEAHYKANPRKDSASFALGRAAHSYLLGDPSQIAVYEGIRNKKFKEYKEFLARHPNKTIVNPREMLAVKGMRMAIEREPEAMRLLEGEREQYMQWELLGHKCAGTPDVWRSDGSVTELKTDDCVEPESFRRSAEKYSYHAQLTWYRAALVAAGKTRESHGPLTIVAVESSAPYCVTIHRLTPQIEADGEQLWRGWLTKLAKAQLLDEWPAYQPMQTDWTSRQLRLAF